MNHKTRLTRLHFENWRSLRQVTLEDLTPITVLVGANSSGKTNVVDGLRFARQAIQRGITDLPQVIFAWKGEKNIRYLGTEGAVRLHVDFGDAPDRMGFHITMFDPHIGAALAIATIFNWGESKPLDDQNRIPLASQIANRWQILGEDFAPPMTMAPESEGTDYLRIHPTAANLPVMLAFMHQDAPEVYAELESDFAWLLGHVQALETVRDERETRFLIREKPLSDAESPTVSGGTRRILAMLTAYYALAMRDADQPGLLVVEEPDHGVHPLLLGNLVSLFRGYTQNPDRPRQIILTTHNPRLVNLFNPEEVRIVERDERGETTINRVPEQVTSVWRERYGEDRVGDVWLTRLLGGVPE